MFTDGFLQGLEVLFAFICPFLSFSFSWHFKNCWQKVIKLWVHFLILVHGNPSAKSDFKYRSGPCCIGAILYILFHYKALLPGITVSVSLHNNGIASLNSKGMYNCYRRKCTLAHSEKIKTDVVLHWIVNGWWGGLWVVRGNLHSTIQNTF